MKKYILIVLSIVCVLALSGCSHDSDETTPTEMLPDVTADDEATASYDVPEVWNDLNASFVRADSSQYNNATLKLKYIGDTFALFEFKLMEGSEAEDSAVDTVVAGIALINEDGNAVYETVDGAENPQTVTLSIDSTADGYTVDVTHSGDFDISPDGHYDFIEAYIEVSDAASVAILEHLPTALTSLNHNNGEYTVGFPDAQIADWFYSVEAVFNDSGAVLAEFLIAKDLSAVFRVDADIEPIMIYGSAQPMMDAYVMEQIPISVDEGSEGGGVESQDYTDDGPEYEPRLLVEVSLADGVYLTPGATSALTAIIPADLPYTITARSSDESVITVDAHGTVTAIAAGESVIDCEITCEDGVAYIGLVVEVGAEE